MSVNAAKSPVYSGAQNYDTFTGVDRQAEAGQVMPPALTQPVARKQGYLTTRRVATAGLAVCTIVLVARFLLDRLRMAPEQQLAGQSAAMDPHSASPVKANRSPEFVLYMIMGGCIGLLIGGSCSAPSVEGLASEYDAY